MDAETAQLLSRANQVDTDAKQTMRLGSAAVWESKHFLAELTRVRSRLHDEMTQKEKKWRAKQKSEM